MIHSLEHAVVIGKFYPFHKGHYFLLHSASVIAKKVTVVVLVDTERETLFPFEKRATFVENGVTIYSPYGPLDNISVVPVYHSLETNYESDDTWKGFADLVREGIKKSPYQDEPSHLVAADPTYGERLASMLNLGYVDLYEDRTLFPISATMIRKNPIKYWEFIHPDVKEHFTKRVVILGAESTGTSTLTEDLHRKIMELSPVHYQSRMIREYGREYIENKLKAANTTIEELDITSSEIEFFAKKQALQEKHVVKQTGCPFIFCDTDAFASQIWHKRYVGDYSDEIEKIIHSQPERTLYVVTSMEDIPLEYDGTRDGDDTVRKEMEQNFITELSNRNLPFMVVKGSRNERVEQVMDVLMYNRKLETFRRLHGIKKKVR